MTTSTFLRAAEVRSSARRLGPPMLIGPGRAAFRWPAIARPEQALRFSMTAYPLGGDVLFDCALDNAPELAISV